MPLPLSVNRKLIQNRDVSIKGYQREDGLWDIEAYLLDSKTHDYPCQDRGGVIKAFDKFHEIWLRITIDDEMVIQDILATIDNCPFKECPRAARVFSRIIGVKIEKGFKKKITSLIMPQESCTHIKELLEYITTTAFQTLWLVRRKKITKDTRHPLTDTCFAFRRDGEFIKRDYPDFYEESKKD